MQMTWQVVPIALLNVILNSFQDLTASLDEHSRPLSADRCLTKFSMTYIDR